MNACKAAAGLAACPGPLAFFYALVLTDDLRLPDQFARTYSDYLSGAASTLVDVPSEGQAISLCFKLTLDVSSYNSEAK